MLIYYRIIPWIIQYEFVLDSRMHLHLWDRRAGDAFRAGDIWICISTCFYFELQMLSRYLMYPILLFFWVADAFPVSGVSAFVFCDFRRCFPDRGLYEFASPLAFLLSCRCFPGIWCILSCFYFELQMLSRYLVYLHLSSLTSADTFRTGRHMNLHLHLLFF